MDLVKSNHNVPDWKGFGFDIFFCVECRDGLFGSRDQIPVLSFSPRHLDTSSQCQNDVSR